MQVRPMRLKHLTLIRQLCSGSNILTLGQTSGRLQPDLCMQLYKCPIQSDVWSQASTSMGLGMLSSLLGPTFLP